MKIYLIDNDDMAINLAQLVKLNGECVKLHWSRRIKITTNVKDALETIEKYVEQFVNEKVPTDCILGELTDEEEQNLMKNIRKSPELREIVGSGVVMANQTEKVKSLINKNELSSILLKALDSDKNIFLF